MSKHRLNGVDPPVINISPLLDSSPSSLSHREVTLKAIKTACVEWGLFQVIGHGMDEEFLVKAGRLHRSFFEKLPVSTKRSLLGIPKSNRGYLDSVVDTSISGVQGHFEWGSEREDILEKNIWPDPTQLPGFQTVMMDCFHELYLLSSKIMEGVLASLGLGQTRILEELKGTDEMSYISSLYYPEGSSGVPPHTDFELASLTLAWDDEGVPGIQVKDENGVFRSLNLPLTSLVFTVGEMLEVMSNGEYKIRLHRIGANPKGIRNILAMTVQPGREKIVEPLRELLGPDNPKTYKSVPYWKEYFHGICAGKITLDNYRMLSAEKAGFNQNIG